MKKLYNFVKKIGSLRNMQVAIRLIENKGYKVTNWNGLQLEILNYGTLEFKEVEGRVWVK